MALPTAIASPGAMVLVGDMHGTREIPTFVGDLVETLAADHHVVLGLEIPAGETPSLDAYLASPGDARG
jgi:hypothetical protein